MAKRNSNGNGNGAGPVAVPEQAELTPTLGSQLRQMREQGVVLPFPSGNNYRVRTVGAARLLRRANLPNILLSFVMNAIYQGVSAEKIDAFMSMNEQEQHALAFLESLRVCCEVVFLEPRIVENPMADDECSIDDIVLADQAWAFDLAFGFARELRPFRPQQEADVGRVVELENVPQASE